jgi:hypothetical protein
MPQIAGYGKTRVARDSVCESPLPSRTKWFTEGPTANRAFLNFFDLASLNG